MEPYESPFRPSPWQLASDGIDVLRITLVASIAVNILFEVIGSSAGTAVFEVVVATIFAAFFAFALDKWRRIPAESGAKGLATLGFAGAVTTLVGACVALLVTLLAVTGSFRSIGALTPWLILVGLSMVVGTILQLIGFLVSSASIQSAIRERPDLSEAFR